MEAQFACGCMLVASAFSAQFPAGPVSLRGEVRAPGKALPSDLIVELRPASGGGSPTNVGVRPDGRFEVDNLQSGPYTVTLRSLAGEVLRQDVTYLSPNGPVLEIELPEREG